MKEVYVLTSTSYGTTTIWGVFSTKELALEERGYIRKFYRIDIRDFKILIKEFDKISV